MHIAHKIHTRVPSISQGFAMHKVYLLFSLRREPHTYIYMQAQIQWAVQILCSFSCIRCCFLWVWICASVSGGGYLFKITKAFPQLRKHSILSLFCSASRSNSIFCQTSPPPPPPRPLSLNVFSNANHAFVVVSRTKLFVYSHNVMQFRQIFLTCIVYQNRQ